MKKMKVLKASTLLLFAVMACNKTKFNQPQTIVNSNTHDGVEGVKQKMYNLTPEQIKSTINFLTAANSPDPNSSKNLLTDSSLWVLEAALNYNFDRNPKDHEVSIESMEYSAPLILMNGSLLVSPSDLKKVYDKFKASVTQLCSGPKKVKVIDITAKIAAGQINYKGNVVLYTDAKIPSNCLPFTTETAAWSTPYMGTGFSCPPTSLPHGPTMVMNKLNNACPAYDPGCPGGGPFGWYWVNVGNSPLFDGYNFNTPSTWFPSSTGKLFYTWKNSPLGVCNGISVSLNANFLNQYVSGCKALAASTNTYPGSFALNYSIIDYWNPLNAGNWQEGGWKMQCTYAVPVCINYEQ
jgi:hypothetical protein